MAVYLGNVRVGNTLPIASNDGVLLTNEQFENLQDAVSYRVGKTEDRNISEIIEDLNEPYGFDQDWTIKVNDEDEVWTRPSGWPDLDSLNLQFTGNNDFIYMTYSTGAPDDFCSFHIELTNTGDTATVDFGHITNGTYVVDSTDTVAHNSNNYYFFNEYATGYVVIRVTGNIKLFRLLNVPAAQSPEGRVFLPQQQHLLERIAYIPNITTINYSVNTQFWSAHSLQREKVGNGTGTKLNDCSYMYINSYCLQDLDITALKTQNCVRFRCMFQNCQNLIHLDISSLNTSKLNATMESLFDGLFSVRELDVSNLDTSGATSLASIFRNCRSLRRIIGLENWNTAKATSMSNMFDSCRDLLDLEGIKNWDIGKVSNFNSMFIYCHSLKHLDLSAWNVSAVTSMGSTFYGCRSLREIKAPIIQTGDLTRIDGCFRECYKLSSIDLSWLKMDSGSCQKMANLFYNCYSIKELHFPSNWNLSGLDDDNTTSHQYLFQNCYSLSKITGITNWDFTSSTATGMSMFANAYRLKDLDISGWKMNSNSYASFFQNCYSLESVNISGFDCSNCTSLASMFNGCWSLKTIVFPTTVWNTSKVTTIAEMFHYCASLTEPPVDITQWDLSKVTTVASLFQECYGLKTVNLSGLSLPLCTTIANMFQYCYRLESVNLRNWSIPKVTSTAPGSFLNYCWQLKEIIGFPPVKLNFSIANSYNLPVEQIVTLFNNLQNTTTTRTINLSTMNLNKLTTAEKQIATNKGWTLAN